MQSPSMAMLETRLSALRNLQLFQQRLYGKNNKPVHMYESIRDDGRVKTMVQLFKKGQATRSRECAFPPFPFRHY